MSVSDKRKDLYYEYLTLRNLKVTYHLINIDSEGYNFLIPSNYHIDYLKSTNDYDNMGHIYFYNDKSKFILDYFKEDYQTFKYSLEVLKDKVKKHFTNYRKQEIYEVVKDNIDYLYMFYDGYMYKLTTDHKLSINEYFDMYFVLYSITNSVIHEDLDLLKALNTLLAKGINALYEGEDLLKSDLVCYDDSFVIDKNDIIVNSDEEYLNYKQKKRQVEIIGHNVLNNNKDNQLSVTHEDDNWIINGTIFFGCLGYYKNGLISEYQEITASLELDEAEKINLLNTIVRQKQMEINSYEQNIKEEFHSYLVDYLCNNLDYELWDKTHFRDFVNFDIISSHHEDTDINLYNRFISYLKQNVALVKKNITLFDYKKISDSINGWDIYIYPDRYMLKLSACNFLLDNISLIIDEHYLIKSV